MEVVMVTYAPAYIFDMDETNWRLINQQMSTIANIGADAVECLFQGDLRISLTTIASVDASWGKLPCETFGKARRNVARVMATIPNFRNTFEVANWF
jgi:hypothetical protein